MKTTKMIWKMKVFIFSNYIIQRATIPFLRIYLMGMLEGEASLPHA